MDHLLKDVVDSARELYESVLSTQRSLASFVENGTDFVESLESCFRYASVYVAGADGPINRDEAQTLNYLLGAGNIGEYEVVRRTLLNDPTLIDAVIAILEQAIRYDALGKEHLTNYIYSAEDDAIVQVVSSLGHAVMAADGSVNRLELRCLTQLTTSLRKSAIAVEAYIVENKQEGAVTAVEESVQSAQVVQNAANETLEQVLSQLYRLTGLAGVKEEVESLANLGKVFSLRRQRGLPVPELSFHLVFTGNPGTGKTTVARIISRIYKLLGLLSRGHLVEVDRSGLVANFVGQTASKVKEVVGHAKGGVLFIDEAYSLASGGENDYGREAIEAIMKSMEDHRDDLIVIVAGYDAKMEKFLQSNPGLMSRFPKIVQFPDYSSAEMCDIFVGMAQASHYHIESNALKVLQSGITRIWSERGPQFGNARDVRNLFERAISAQANRIAIAPNLSDSDLMMLSDIDLRTALR